MPPRLGRSLLALSLLVLLAGLAHAQEQPPWDRPGHAFHNNPAGYARSLHRQYVANQAETARLRALLPTLRRERTGAEMSGIGFFDALRDATEVARRRRETEAGIAEGEAARARLEAEWAQWCELGLLGSPMPPLSAANEMIEDPYLDNSTFPGVIRKRLTDRIDYNLRYFLEEKLGGVRPPAGGGGGGAGGAFTQEPWNGLQVTYSISGASLGAFEDGGPFEGWIRTYSGGLGTGTLRATGTVVKTTASEEFPADAHITVRAGEKQETKSFHLVKGAAQAYDVSVPIPPGARSGQVSVVVIGQYHLGEERFVQVVANLTADGAGGGAAPGTGGGDGGGDGPTPPPADAPVDEAEGRIYLLGDAPTVVPEEGGEGASVTAGAPIDWDLEGWLTTGAEDPVVLVFPEAYRATLSGGSALGLGSEDGVILRDGSAYHDVEPRGDDFTVTTRCGVASTRGARFATEVLDNDALLVAVLTGSVEVTGLDRDQTSVTVMPRQAAMVVLGDAPSESVDLTADQIDALFAGDFKLLLGPLPLPEGGAAPPEPAGGAEALADVGDLRVGTGMENGQLVGVGDRLAAPTRIAVQYEYRDLPEGSVCEVVWSRDGDELLRDTRTLKTSGRVAFTISMQGGADPMPPGRYTATLSIGGSVVGRKSFTVTE